MTSYLQVLLTNIESSIQDSVDLLDSVEADDFDETLEFLSTAIVHGAMQLHSCRQSKEEAVDGLLSYVFDEVLGVLPANEREGFQGKAHVQTHGTTSMDGVVPCQKWTVSYCAAPGWKGLRTPAQ